MPIAVETKKMKLSDIHINKDNPRTIDKKKMDKLVKSIQKFPEMLQLREVVVDENMVILGGNMRAHAMQISGIDECVAKIVTGLTQEQKREFIIKDNASFGEWDMDVLANIYSDMPLIEFGLDLNKNWLEEVKIKNEKPEVEFSEEFLLTHNYVVLYFDNDFDWNVAQEVLGLKMVKDLITRKDQPVGIGRVIKGAPIIKKLAEGQK